MHYMYFSDCTAMLSFLTTCISKCSQTAFQQSLALMFAGFICICGFGVKNLHLVTRSLSRFVAHTDLGWWIQCKVRDCKVELSLFPHVLSKHPLGISAELWFRPKTRNASESQSNAARSKEQVGQERALLAAKGKSRRHQGSCMDR